MPARVEQPVVAKPEDVLVGEKIEQQYVALSSLRKWDRNPKRHELRKLIEIFIRHGFKDPVKWEPKLNKGKGGIGAGNGRYAALSYMKENGMSNPRGIMVRESDGEWFVPCNFGVEAKSLLEAEAFGFDHNAATLFGSGLSDEQQLAIWNLDELKPSLREVEEPTQLPLALQHMQESILEKLLGGDELELEGAENEEEPTPETQSVKGVPKHVRMYQLFLDTETIIPFKDAIERLKVAFEKSEQGLDGKTGTDIVYRAVLEYADQLNPREEPLEEVVLEPEVASKPQPKNGDFVVVAPEGELCQSCTEANGVIVALAETGKLNQQLKKSCTCPDGYKCKITMYMEEENEGDSPEGTAPY